MANTLWEVTNCFYITFIELSPLSNRITITFLPKWNLSSIDLIIPPLKSILFMWSTFYKIKLFTNISISWYAEKNLNFKLINVNLRVNSNLPTGRGCKMHWVYYIFIHLFDIYACVCCVCGLLIIRLVNIDINIRKLFHTYGLRKFHNLMSNLLFRFINYMSKPYT